LTAGFVAAAAAAAAANICPLLMQATATGDAIAGLPGTRPLGMISVVFYDTPPPKITADVRKAYIQAIQKLVPGAPHTLLLLLPLLERC
jgi:hypothetical protein